MGKNIWAVYFSPVDGTRCVVCSIAERFADALGVQVKKIDFTKKENRERTYEFSETDVVVFGSPVYAGRIPNKIMPDWKRCFAGNGAAAVAVCSFGNRNYDGALDELHLILQQNGFRVMGKAAVVCQHVFSKKVGTGRPDAADWEEIQAFAQNLAGRYKANPEVECGIPGVREGNPAENFPDKQEAKDVFAENRKHHHVDNFMYLPDDFEVRPYYTPLKTDGTPAKFLKAKPLTKESCTDCGQCVLACPLGSIDADNPRLVSGICIKCQACILKCPEHAKYFVDEDFLSHVKMLETNYTARRENTFFA